MSNDTTLSTNALVAAYRQLREVHKAFRVPRTLVRLRPIRHWADVRVRSQVSLCVIG